MTVKRSRSRVYSDATASFPTPALKKPTADVRFQKSTGIFTISSPVIDSIHHRIDGFDRKICSFPDKCCYCCKNFAKGHDIFMYSMQAFCSKECREKQIDIDKERETLRVNPRI